MLLPCTVELLERAGRDTNLPLWQMSFHLGACYKAHAFLDSNILPADTFSEQQDTSFHKVSRCQGQFD